MFDALRITPIYTQHISACHTVWLHTMIGAVRLRLWIRGLTVECGHKSLRTCPNADQTESGHTFSWYTHFDFLHVHELTFHELSFLKQPTQIQRWVCKADCKFRADWNCYHPHTSGDGSSQASTLSGRDNGVDVSWGPYIVLVDMMRVDTCSGKVCRCSNVGPPAGRNSSIWDITGFTWSILS